ncbi:MAG: hypothetical protein J5617_04170 [Bacilli bacterium]|nr:hypothetical protein [Bacilli bacterium]
MLKPYWKSKSHVTIFIITILAHLFIVVSFALDMYAYMQDPASADPEAPARITTLIVVIAVLVSFIVDIIFFTDLFRYIRLKRRTSQNIKSNVEIYAEGAGKEDADKEAKKMLRMSEVIADVTTENQNTTGAEFDCPQESIKRPSLKATLVTMFYAVGLPLLAIFAMFFVGIFLFFFMIDSAHPLDGLRNATSLLVLVILIFVVAMTIIMIIQRVRLKKRTPKAAGIRVYPEYIEQYVVSYKEAMMETRYKVNYNNMKRMQTKNFYIVKGKVNNQTAVITILKKELPAEALELIESRYLKAKEAKEAQKKALKAQKKSKEEKKAK